MAQNDPKTAALTGGIASGKSTVSAMFHELGAVIIDADRVAAQIVEPGQPAWQDIIDQFGREILRADSRLDRQKLGDIIFRHPEKRRLLNQITHPRVITAIDRQMQDIRYTQPQQLIIVDVPLLIEASMHTAYAVVIVVYVSEAVQLARLMQRDGISEEDAHRKIQAQMPLSDKIRYATHVITNDDGLENTRKQVISVYQQIA
ncbi:dephospho-CoA kinase [candidate division KSB3 bacterium]|uniref:Dephospho-CoA kinase n=1 Tax=candidate division KSB3 bacterium TaxID=2044937 RepID=A0A9D5JVS1_9BACT|nr:dephospho-CoA kinase [candidate division KSB3 bacterium]MBD3325163.1 dephospho-CoA kinase [candidate division KSB3 bacterium]